MLNDELSVRPNDDIYAVASAGGAEDDLLDQRGVLELRTRDRHARSGSVRLRQMGTRACGTVRTRVVPSRLKSGMRKACTSTS